MKIILKPMGAILLLIAFATITVIASQNRSGVAQVQDAGLAPVQPSAPIPDTKTTTRQESGTPRSVSAITTDVTAQVLENPDFAGGNQIIPGWGVHKSADKRLHITGDTTQFQSASSSLRLWTDPGSGRVLGRGGSSVFKVVPAKPGGAFTVSVSVCKRGRWNRAEIVVHLFDKNWGTNSYTTVASFAGQKDGEWKTYAGAIPVDDKTASGVIYIIGDGDGTLNLDDLRVTVAP